MILYLTSSAHPTAVSPVAPPVGARGRAWGLLSVDIAFSVILVRALCIHTRPSGAPPE